MAKKMEMEHKQFDAFVTEVEEDQGIIKAIFSVFGNVDEGYDRIHPGSFAKTFAERGHKVLVLDNHNMFSAGDAVAKVLGLRELSKEELPPEVLEHYPEADGGAEITAQFEPNPAADAKSAGIFYRLKNQWLKEWSFGYDALDFDFTDESVKGEPARVRNLRTIKLYEVSPVLLGMNTATTTTSAKSATPSEGKPYGAIREGDMWHVYKLDEDGEPTGESLGDHETEEEADAQVAALYASEEENEPENDGKAADEPEDTKAGRVLSARNATRLTNAFNVISEVLKDAGMIIENQESEEDGKSTTDGKSITDRGVLVIKDPIPHEELKYITERVSEYLNNKEPEGPLIISGIDPNNVKFFPIYEETEGPPRSAPTAPTSPEAGPQATLAPNDSDYLKLIEIERLKSRTMEV